MGDSVNAWWNRKNIYVNIMNGSVRACSGLMMVDDDGGVKMQVGVQ